MIKNKSYSIPSEIILTNEIITSYINKFWNDIFKPLTISGEIHHLMILSKVNYSNSENSKW